MLTKQLVDEKKYIDIYSKIIEEIKTKIPEENEDENYYITN